MLVVGVDYSYESYSTANRVRASVCAYTLKVSHASITPRDIVLNDISGRGRHGRGQDGPGAVRGIPEQLQPHQEDAPVGAPDHAALLVGFDG